MQFQTSLISLIILGLLSLVKAGEAVKPAIGKTAPLAILATLDISPATASLPLTTSHLNSSAPVLNTHADLDALSAAHGTMTRIELLDVDVDGQKKNMVMVLVLVTSTGPLHLATIGPQLREELQVYADAAVEKNKNNENRKNLGKVSASLAADEEEELFGRDDGIEGRSRCSEQFCLFDAGMCDGCR
ncbi:hypothetical protein F4778DRAFT_800543 [Xylariomycetidae sp. FL2044]|nr:hypothetical protein F4778DRAFT_800543 [Xylariomycetidae sp. FL2044]